MAMVCVCPGKPDVMIIWIVQITLMKRAVHVVAESSAALMVLVFPKSTHVMADLIVRTAPMNKIVCVMQASSGAGVVSV